MIYDTIDNISRYEGMDKALVEGLRFLQQATADTPTGRHELSDGSYANVEVYTTRRENPVGYETHQRFVDIQCLLSGQERVRVRQADEIVCGTPYQADRDAAFYPDDGTPATEVTLKKGTFVILFPNDAHEPQLCVDEPEEVKKVVVKVRMEVV